MTISKTIFSELPDDQLLGLNIWAEAEGELTEGKIAVGSVVLNRVAFGSSHRRWGEIYGNTIKGVILAPNQFSWTRGDNLRHPKCVELARAWAEGRPATDKALIDCLFIAIGLIDGKIKVNTSALFYEARGTGAKWAKGKTVLIEIGNHIFYA